MRAVVLILLLVTYAAPAFPHQEKSPTVPFTLHRGHLILVSAEIGGSRDLVFMLDTGAGRTVVSKTVTEQLGLTGRPTQLQSFGQTISAEELIVPDLVLGPLRVRDYPVVATDLSSTALALQLARLDGILGIDILRRSSFGIDYVRSIVRFDSIGPLPNRAPLATHPFLLVVAARVHSRPLQLIVDSGASHLALFGFPDGHGATLRGADQPVHLGGKADVRTILLPRIEVGTWIGERIPAVVMDGAAKGPTGADGLLGLPALGASFIQFDFRTHEISWN